MEEEFPIRDVNFSPESVKRVEELYNSVASSCDKVTDWDDLVTPSEKSLLSKLEEEAEGRKTCPLLRKLGNYFYYCDSLTQELVEKGYDLTRNPSSDSPQYKAKQERFELQLWCMNTNEEYCKCINFPRKL